MRLLALRYRRTLRQRLYLRRRELGGIGLALLLMVLGFSWGGGVPGAGESVSAVWHFSVLSDGERALGAGRLPLWNSRLGLGYPVWAAEGKLLANPMVWPLLFSSPKNLLMLLVPMFALLAWSGFYLLARSRRYGQVVAALGATVYAANGWLTGRLFAGRFEDAVIVVAIPAFAWLFVRPARLRIWFLTSGLAAWVAATAGLMGLLWAGVGALVVLSALSRDRRSSGCPEAWMPIREPLVRRLFSVAALGAALFVLLSAAALLLPAWELWSRSGLSAEISLRQFLLSPTALLEVLLPGGFGGGGVPRWAGSFPAEGSLYFGLLGLLPLAIWPAVGETERRLLLGLLKVAGVAVILALLGELPVFGTLLRAVPEFTALVQPSRFVLVALLPLAWFVMAAAQLFQEQIEQVRDRAVILFGAAAAFFLVVMIGVTVFESVWSRAFEAIYSRSEFRALLEAGSEPEARRRWLGMTPAEVTAWLAVGSRRTFQFAALQQAVVACGWVAVIVAAGRSRRLRVWVPQLFLIGLMLDLFAGTRHIRTWTDTNALLPLPVLADTGPEARVVMPNIPSWRNSTALSSEKGRRAFLGWMPRRLNNQAEAVSGNAFIGPPAERADATGAVRQLVALGGSDLYWSGPASKPIISSGLKSEEDGRSAPGDRVISLPGAFPRIRGVADFLAVEGRQVAVSRLARDDFDNRRTVVATEILPLPERLDSTPPLEFSGEVVGEPPNRLDVRVRSNMPALAVMAEAAYPGWKARVDDRRAPIYEVNGWLRAVPVPDGASAVRLEYSPFSYRLGLFLSLGAWAIWIGFAIKYFGRRQSSP